MSSNLQQKKSDIILDSIADGVFTVDNKWQITSFNKAAEQITGVPREAAMGSFCGDVLHADCCEKDCALKKTIASQTPIVNKQVSIVNNHGDIKTISISTAILRDKNGKISGGVETFRDISVEQDLRKQLYERYSREDIITVSHKIQKLFDILPEIAGSPVTVLVQGESGTGKELFARAIHNLSARKNKPFIAVNCAALPDTLLESELFGYVAGAFTDAKKDKPGRFKLADKGTIFLDEIGDISPALQMKLLRVIQEKEFQPLGGSHVEKTDVRIITATNKNLEQLIKKNLFRQDLYYRINVVKIELPPLRERMEDVNILCEHFINKFNATHKKNIKSISGNALACLMNYNFPGNIRELENIIERAFVMCREEIILPEHLPSEICQIQSDENDNSSFDDIEASFLMNALKRNDWNRLATAKELGIHKTTLFRKIKKLNLKLPK
ncbi:MAG: Fis family transcriptional regulator [Chlamydiae bacterium]|nr:MAG: Fis family transcriptional regulator [Chlamydiota bacterium]